MEIRKLVTLVDEIRLEAGQVVDPPVRRVIVHALVPGLVDGDPRQLQGMLELLQRRSESSIGD